jgi:hypothetical protein
MLAANSISGYTENEINLLLVTLRHLLFSAKVHAVSGSRTSFHLLLSSDGLIYETFGKLFELTVIL